jgi:predicted house-cleaning noncanonical NTP pyrophosphatase (MazG superfamily)
MPGYFPKQFLPMKWNNQFPQHDTYPEASLTVPGRIEVLPGIYHFVEVLFSLDTFTVNDNQPRPKDQFASADLEWLDEGQTTSIGKPMKLIRESIKYKLKETEYERITDKDHLNSLFVLKVQEELAEVVSSNFEDVNEFGDLLYTVIAFAETNGIRYENLYSIMHEKVCDKGMLTNLVLTNLNPNNPSNSLYFKK